MIRVLQFTDVINKYDFIDTIVQFANRERFGMSVCVRTDESNIERPEYGEETKFRVLPWNGRAGMPAAALKLSKLLKEWKIDIVHAHHFDPAVIAWLATRLYPKTKFVFGRHYSDLIQDLPASRRRYFLAAEQVMNRAADRIVVPSTMIANILTERQGIDGSKIDIVPYGFASAKYADISPERIAAAAAEFGFDGKFVVVSLGKLTIGKGVRYLADAAVKLKEKIPNLLVLFIGEGDERAYIESLIEQHGMHDTLKIAGWRTDAMVLLAGADVVVQPTLSEAFSQVMGEAMWMKKPLVMTDVSGVADVIDSGSSGLIIKLADADEIAKAIHLLFVDSTMRESIAEAGKALVESRLSVEKIIPKYEHAYIASLRNDKRGD